MNWFMALAKTMQIRIWLGALQIMLLMTVKLYV